MLATATLIVGIVRDVISWPSYDLSLLEKLSIPIIAGVVPGKHTTRKGWLTKDFHYERSPYTCDINEPIWTTQYGEKKSLREIGKDVAWFFRKSIRTYSDPFSFRLLFAIYEGRAPSLLELSDPSRPLLRRLSLEAPGTYAHSIAMANLVEAACNRIGANGLLGRVGCYYHDVGKLTNPQYFVENQTYGGNPHDRLKAAQSVEIIKAHVTGGLKLAAEAGLPSAVAAFIPEHHGTSEITYFLDRAKKQGDGNANSDDYRYPGPKPRSAETAIAMMADSVEAALRVLDELTPRKIEDAIDHIVKNKVNAGQLDETPMTLQQIDDVKAEFVRVLSSMYHNRIDYPEASGGLSANWQPPAAS